MAQFVHQYVKELLDRQAAVGPQLGVGIYGVSRELYGINLTLLTLLGVVMKTISEVAPVVTDQVWIERLNHALDANEASPWPAYVLNQVDPNAPPSQF
jgi:hypothetical protein